MLYLVEFVFYLEQFLPVAEDVGYQSLHHYFLFAFPFPGRRPRKS